MGSGKLREPLGQRAGTRGNAPSQSLYPSYCDPTTTARAFDPGDLHPLSIPRPIPHQDPASNSQTL